METKTPEDNSDPNPEQPIAPNTSSSTPKAYSYSRFSTPSTPNTPKSSRRRLWIRRILLAFLVLAILIGIGVGVYLYSFAKSIGATNSNTSVVEQIQHIITNDEKLRGEEDGRINVLLLGYGGEDHPGGALTDTVMIASVQPFTHDVTFISIPRDFVVPIPPENLRTAEYLKINSVLVHGDVEMMEKIIALVTGLTIHYHVLVDFSGFTQVVDALGGVDIAVPNSFEGYYGSNQLAKPCPAGKTHVLDDGPYCVISFESGTEHMDGARALMYSRIRKLTRNSENSEEGSDYARAARQQLVIQAIKDKTLSVGTVLNPIAVNNILGAIGSHVDTNMEVFEMLRFGNIAKEVSSTNIQNLVLDANPQTGVLIETRSAATGAFITEPRAGLSNYTEIQTHIANTLAAPDRAREIPADEADEEGADSNENENGSPAKIILQNGSGIAGLAGKVEQTLEQGGTSIVSVGNATTTSLATTLVYDFSGGEQSAAAERLAKRFGVSVTPASRPTGSAVRLATDPDPRIIDLSSIDNTVDIVVVLGKDQRAFAQ